MNVQQGDLRISKITVGDNLPPLSHKGWVGGCIRTIWTVQFQLVITFLCTLIEFCELFYFRNTCTYQYDIFYRVFNKHGIRNLLLYFVYDSNIKTLFMKVETAPSIQCQIFCSTRQNFENGVAVKFHACFKNVKFLRYSVSIFIQLCVNFSICIIIIIIFASLEYVQCKSSYDKSDYVIFKVIKI